MKPITSIISITRVTDAQRGILYLLAQLISGLQAIAIKADNRNGTIMTLAALIPARTIMTQAITIIAFAMGDLISM
jgi:hypothetical protein